jgi:hypothetical protein
MDINLSEFGYLTKSIPNYSIAWLLLSSLFMILVGYATFYLITKKEISEKIKKEIDAEQIKIALKLREEAKASEDARVCQEKIRWANPSDIAVNGIYYRLKNIIHGGAHVALSEKHKERIYPNWSIDYEYFFNSTLYLFAQYFAWARLMEEDLSIELFKSFQEKETLSKALFDVSACLSVYPSKYGGNGIDSQVFKLQQLAIAELLIISENRNSPRWMTYPEFLKKIKDDDDFEYHMRPLKNIIENILPDQYRWKRLNATMEALSELKKVMINLEILQARKNPMPSNDSTKDGELKA